MAQKNTKSIIQFVVLLSIGIILIWLSIRQVRPEKERIFEAFRNADYFWVGVSMLISFLSHFIRAYRWNYLLRPVGYKVGLVNSVCYVLIGYLANYGIPRMGEVSRCSLATKYDKVPFEVAFGTVITERIVDFLIFLVIFVLTLAFQFSELIGLANKLVFAPLSAKFAGPGNARMWLALGLTILGVAVVFLMRKKIMGILKGKLGGIIKGMAQGIGSIMKLKNPWKFVLLSLMIWASYFYSLYACFFALDATSHLGQKECLTLLLFGTFGVIFSPGGLGAYPAILGGILIYTYNIDIAYAFALPWLSWTNQFILVLVTGLACLIILPIYNRKKDVVSQPAQV
jgi:glycosyltransferase 2 family protein